MLVFSQGINEVRINSIGYAIVSYIFIVNAAGFLSAGPLVQAIDHHFGRTRVYSLGACMPCTYRYHLQAPISGNCCELHSSQLSTDSRFCVKQLLFCQSCHRSSSPRFHATAATGLRVPLYQWWPCNGPQRYLTVPLLPRFIVSSVDWYRLRWLVSLASREGDACMIAGSLERTTSCQAK